MSSESEEDPFAGNHTDSDSEFIPTSDEMHTEESENSSKKVSQDMFLNFRDHYSRLFLKTPSTKQNKFKISKYRIFKYDKNNLPTFSCSESVSLPIFHEFSLQKKPPVAITLPEVDQVLYNAPRLLKKKKFEHVMELAKHYVPAVDMWFYERIAEYHKTFENDNKATSCSEYESDE